MTKNSLASLLFTAPAVLVTRTAAAPGSGTQCVPSTCRLDTFNTVLVTWSSLHYTQLSALGENNSPTLLWRSGAEPHCPNCK